MDNIDYLKQIFDDIRKESENTTQQGKCFENLIQQWLMTEPTYKDNYLKVLTYSAWVDEFGGQFGFTNHNDIGIDLVAQNADNTNTFTAIQCKFYSEDNTITKEEMNSFFTASENTCFTTRILVSSNQKLSENFKETCKTSSKDIIWIKYSDLENSTVDWEYFLHKNSMRQFKKRELFDFQKNAVSEVVSKFQNDNITRGKLIMACGTGKTFTSLKIAEQLAPNGIVLFLVPSLALLSQTLRDWKQQNENILAFAVCSDESIGINKNKDTNGENENFMDISDLAYPATTNAKNLAEQYYKYFKKNTLNLVENDLSNENSQQNSNPKMTVIFATYQSSVIIGEAQQKYGFPDIDLMICDEAHRTATGKFKSDKNNGETNFSYVHKDKNIKADKRLYMTATPKIYGKNAKKQQNEGDVVLYSMDDEKIYGQTLYTINFDEAIQLGRLVDFKVIILTLPEREILDLRESYLKKIYEKNQNISFDFDIHLDYFGKIVGCYKALQKYGLENDLKDDFQAMKRAIGFAQVIDYEHEKNNVSSNISNENFKSKKSKKTKLASKFFADYFSSIVEAYKTNEIVKLQAENKFFHEISLKNFGLDLDCETKHIDGSMSAVEKNQILDWLRAEPAENHCKILFNVRCLSEGIDVPSLDAVIFLSPRKSEVEIVQTVGRVMRVDKEKKKKRGYVIIPILLPEQAVAKDFLDNSEEFGTVWKILCAMRSIDPNFSLSADIEKGNLDSRRIEVISTVSEIKKYSNNADSLKNSNQNSNQNSNDENYALDEVSQKNKAEQLKKEQQQIQEQLQFMYLDNHALTRLIKARIVKRVGNRRTWEDWAEEVGGLCDKQIANIKRIINNNSDVKKQIFDKFVQEINNTLNGNLSDDGVCELLAQHLVMQPIMEELFTVRKNVSKDLTNAKTAELFDSNNSKNNSQNNSQNNSKNNSQNLVENVIYNYAEQNPIAKAMNNIFYQLDADSLQTLKNNLSRFRGDLHRKIQYTKHNDYNVISAAQKQNIIRQLFDKFFKIAFPKQQEKLGIVYTPLEIVDFINHSVNDLLQQEFNQQISDQNVHILDPFTGTGSFLTRLMQNDIIIPKDKLEYKFKNDLHANEIMPLSYYVAGINFETVFHEILPDATYEPNQILTWTDTFANDKFILQQQQQQSKQITLFDNVDLQENNLHLQRQNDSDIRIIIGNPPYSVGQKSQNDNNQNDKYKILDKRLQDTYLKHGKKGNKNSLYDSYIRAFRWATDRIENNGIIGFVCNAGWLDSSAADGMRYCLEREFAKIYIYHLKGDQRTSGETSLKQGGKIFGSGSRAPICIVFLIKKKDFHEKAKIFYSEVKDYLSREAKLQLIKQQQTILNLELNEITPNENNDWLNQRDDSFNKFIRCDGKKADENEIYIFKNFSLGVTTARDNLAYNSKKSIIEYNMNNIVIGYNEALELYNNGESLEKASQAVNNLVSWSSILLNRLKAKKQIEFTKEKIVNSIYRPFIKQFLYYDKNGGLTHTPGFFNEFFPRENSKNLCICVSGIGNSDFSCVITNQIPDYQLMFNCQCFPLYLYAEKTILNSTITFEKIDAITDEALKHFQEPFVETINKIDIFYYIYGLLHSKEYRTKYANNLMKQLPRIPRMKTFDVFNKFKSAGKDLAHLHLHFDDFNNETIANYEKSLTIHKDAENYEVSKIEYAKFDKSEGKKGNAAKNKSKIIYNNNITIENIPAAVQEYIVNKKSALDWIVERCCVKQDKDSQIVNNFNDYCKEIGNPKYIYQLIINVIYISLESVKIINNLPSLEIYEKDL